MVSGLCRHSLDLLSMDPTGSHDHKCSPCDRVHKSVPKPLTKYHRYHTYLPVQYIRNHRNNEVEGDEEEFIMEWF